MPWYNQPVPDVLEHVRGSESGLSAREAAVRLTHDGPNTLHVRARAGVLRLFARQFKSLIIGMLVVAAVVSVVLGETRDAIVILAIVVLNAAIGFFQEWSAAKSIAALKLLTAPMAKVRRDGVVTTLAAEQIVVGDLLILEAGDLVAADARLLLASSLSINESTLTGESTTVDKDTRVLSTDALPLGDRANMVYTGTAVATGAGEAIVVAIGMDTELGRIAGLLGDTEHDALTPLQQSLHALGRVLVWASLGIITLLFALGMWRGTPWLELLMTSVSLAVAAVPEGLPAVVTVALSLGVLRMARRGALVRKLAAAETLGSTSVICTDKTGTLTVGAMTVRSLYVAHHRYRVAGEGYAPTGDVFVADTPTLANEDPVHRQRLDVLATIMVGCNSTTIEEVDGAWKAIGDPTEAALLVAGTKCGWTRERVDKLMPKVAEFPFDSDRKRSSVVRHVIGDGTYRVLVNGAPGALLERSTHMLTDDGIRPITAEDRAQILEQISHMAQHALRVLSSATRDLGASLPDPLTADVVERELTFVGFAGMYDPPRPEVQKAIADCRAAGVRVVMITGDHPDTAVAVARDLGFDTADHVAVSGRELDAMSDATLRDQVAAIRVFARVSAEHKLRIVRAWQARDAIVAMTGDGVNDAPAIQGADVGVAMGRAGTEVTRQAADIIITDDNFATIVNAIREGRGIYDNIRKTLQYVLAGNTGELLLMAACVMVGLPTPLLPIHLLWINLVTDGLPAIALAIDPFDPDVMSQPPRQRHARLANRHFWRATLFTGAVTAAVVVSVFVFALQTQPLPVARSWAFSVLVVAELLRAFGARSEHASVWQMRARANVSLLAVIGISLGFQFWSQHSATLGRVLQVTPISLAVGAVLLAVGAIPMVVMEIVKVVRRSRIGRIV